MHKCMAINKVVVLAVVVLVVVMVMMKLDMSGTKMMVII